MHKTPLLKNFPLNYTIFFPINHKILTWPSRLSFIRQNFSLAFLPTVSQFPIKLDLVLSYFQASGHTVSLALQCPSPTSAAKFNLSFKTWQPFIILSSVSFSFISELCYFWLYLSNGFYSVTNTTIYYCISDISPTPRCFSSTLPITGTQ